MLTSVDRRGSHWMADVSVSAQSKSGTAAATGTGECTAREYDESTGLIEALR